MLPELVASTVVVVKSVAADSDVTIEQVFGSTVIKERSLP